LVKKKVKKLNIFEVNGVWQYGLMDHDDDDEDATKPDDHVQ